MKTYLQNEISDNHNACHHIICTIIICTIQKVDQSQSLLLFIGFILRLLGLLLFSLLLLTRLQTWAQPRGEAGVRTVVSRGVVAMGINWDDEWRCVLLLVLLYLYPREGSLLLKLEELLRMLLMLGKLLVLRELLLHPCMLRGPPHTHWVLDSGWPHVRRWLPTRCWRGPTWFNWSCIYRCSCRWSLLVPLQLTVPALIHQHCLHYVSAHVFQGWVDVIHRLVYHSFSSSTFTPSPLLAAATGRHFSLCCYTCSSAASCWASQPCLLVGLWWDWYGSGAGLATSWGEGGVCTGFSGAWGSWGSIGYYHTARLSGSTPLWRHDDRWWSELSLTWCVHVYSFEAANANEDWQQRTRTYSSRARKRLQLGSARTRGVMRTG